MVVHTILFEQDLIKNPEILLKLFQMPLKSKNRNFKKGETSSRIEMRVDKELFREIPYSSTNDSMIKKFRNMSSTQPNLFICSEYERRQTKFLEREIVKRQIPIMKDLNHI